MALKLIAKVRDWLRGVRWTSGPPGIPMDAVIVLGFVVVVTISCFSPWPWDASPWIALSAIATFLATGVALWLGWREGAWRRQDEREKQDREDILLAMRTGNTGKALYMIVKVREALASGDASTRYDDETFILMKAVEELSEIDHARLLQVDQDAGISLARCIANINGVIPMLLSAANNEEVRLMAFDCMVNAHTELGEVIEFLYTWTDNPLNKKKG